MQVFDQKKFKKKDQGFLGVINIRVGDVMSDLTPEANGMSPFILSLAFGLPCLLSYLDNALFLGLL